MSSFGPNMSLARDLLEGGEREAVFGYFEQCRTFWTGHGDILDEWIKEIQAGSIPDFGGNMIY